MEIQKNTRKSKTVVDTVMQEAQTLSNLAAKLVAQTEQLCGLLRTELGHSFVYAEQPEVRLVRNEDFESGMGLAAPNEEDSDALPAVRIHTDTVNFDLTDIAPGMTGDKQLAGFYKATERLLAMLDDMAETCAAENGDGFRTLIYRPQVYAEITSSGTLSLSASALACVKAP